MDFLDVARNVRRNRIAKGFSQRKLAGSAGISELSVKNIESAKVEARIKTLQSIAKALGVKLNELFVPVKELQTVRFRSTKNMRKRENILARAARWLEDFNYLEGVLGRKSTFHLEDIRDLCSRNEPAEAARICREKLGLDSKEPIHDICGLLEKAGVKVLTLPLASDGFFGLSIGQEDGGPAIIVNDEDRITPERRIFSAAHELGHLMLHPEAFNVKETLEDKEQERQADCFAGYFLMPDAGFINEWDEASGLHWVDRVLKVKGIFRVSYKTVLKRLIDLGKTDESIWPKFYSAYRNRYKKKLMFKEEPDGFGDGNEPFRLAPFVFFEDRFNRLVREAVEKDKISLSRGAEMLGMPILEMRELIQSWETVA